jgi:SMI1 / KNR4 family (SUKH-1)
MTASPTIERIQEKAKSRGIRLSSTLIEEDIASFEHSNGISLPSDYREFVLRVGNGGVGPPDYGLCALGQTPSDFDFASPDLSRPFPFTQPWIWEDGGTSSEGQQADAYCGVVILGTDGCGQYWAVVVRGPDYGKIWMLADVGIQPTIPSMTFIEWYETWLDGKRDWWG